MAALSGGQRTRLSLARLSVTRAPLLVLDEPTNHLDLRASEASETVLLAFPGTVLLASHDRTLVRRVATRDARNGARDHGSSGLRGGMLGTPPRKTAPVGRLSADS